MDETLQEIIALTIVVLVAAVALLRRYRNARSAKPGCAGCESGAAHASGDKREAPVKFYKKTG